MFCQKGKRNRLLYEDYLVHLQLKLLEMRIGYDGKRAVQNFTGLGNYSRYVVQSLSAFAPENEYWLYAPVHRENQQLSSMVAESRGTVSVHYPSYWLWKE